MVLARDEILQRYEDGVPLVSFWEHTDEEVDAAYQPNGVDLSVGSIQKFSAPGRINRQGKILPERFPVEPVDGVWLLPMGTYVVTYNETINLSNDVMAYTLPRSSLLRMGVTLHGAVWDAGYCGIGEGLLVVHNPYGVRIENRSRVAQMVFHYLAVPVSVGYSGSYQGEGLDEFR